MHVFLHALLWTLGPVLSYLAVLAAALYGVDAFVDSEGPWLWPAVALIVLAPFVAAFCSRPLVRRVPARCSRCGGRALPHRRPYRFRLGIGSRSDEPAEPLTYGCSSCSETIAPWDLEHLALAPRRFLARISILWRLPLVAVLAFGCVVIFGGVAAPIVVAMFAGAYIFGIGLQFLVRVFPQEHPANRPTAWREYFLYAAGTLFFVAITCATGRAIVLAPYLGRLASTGEAPSVENRLLAPLPYFDWTLGACALAYAILGPGREALARLVVLLRARGRTVSQALSPPTPEAIVAVEGQARAIEVREEGQEIVVHVFTLLGDSQLGNTRVAARSFDIEDETGRLRVELPRETLSVRLPFPFSIFRFARSTTAELVLSARVEPRYWPDRRVELRDGDPVLVIGRLHPREGEAAPRFGVHETRPRGAPFARHFEALSLRRPASAGERLLVTDTTGVLGRARLWSGVLQVIVATGLWFTAGTVLLSEPVLRRLARPVVQEREVGPLNDPTGPERPLLEAPESADP